MKDLVGDTWLTEQRGSLMVVTSLFAGMACQAANNPMGGVWQDSTDGHRAGEAVMGYTYPDTYPHFLRANAILYYACLSTILLIVCIEIQSKFWMWTLKYLTWLANRIRDSYICDLRN